MEASLVDGSPLSAELVRRYFINFGSLEWCLQAGGTSTVIFRFTDPALFETTLRFNHFIKEKPLRLIPMKNRGASSDLQGHAAGSAPANIGETSRNEVSRLINHIDELVGSVNK